MWIGLKKIMKYQKAKEGWNVENLYVVRQKGKFSRGWLVGIGCGIENVKVQRNNISKFVLDTVIGLVVKVERRQRETCITQKVINKGLSLEVGNC